jgi:hypothetical protein
VSPPSPFGPLDLRQFSLGNQSKKRVERQQVRIVPIQMAEEVQE